jgi:hypothetical protein
MPSSGMLRRVDLVSTDVSEKRSASIIRVTRVGELGKMLAVTSNRLLCANIAFLRSLRRLLVTANVVPSSPILATVLMEELSSLVTSTLKKAPQLNIPEDDIPQEVYTSMTLK